MGLGDCGINGISQFKSQHQCNTICKKLGLRPLPDSQISISESDFTDEEVLYTGNMKSHGNGKKPSEKATTAVALEDTSKKVMDSLTPDSGDGDKPKDDQVPISIEKSISDTPKAADEAWSH